MCEQRQLIIECTKHKSERRDLNPRPPLPQSGALPSCATPRLPMTPHCNNNLYPCQVKKVLKIE